MSNPYYTHSTYPSPNAPGSSAALRAELELITAGFGKLPTLSGNANKLVVVNSAGTALIAATTFGSVAITNSTIDSTPIGATTASTGRFAGLTVSSGAASLGASVTIAGGVIDNTIIGGTTRAAGSFTTLSANAGITGALTGNVTGNLTGAVAGNVTGNLTGNVTANSGTSTFNNLTVNGTLDMDAGSSATIINLATPVNSGDAANKGYVDSQDALRLPLAGGTMSGNIAMNTSRVTGLGDPSAAQDAATKNYVDSVAQGLDAKASARVATTANISLSGTQTIDGVAVIAGDRVLVKDQSTGSQNGIYVVATGSWSRSTDADTWDELVAAFIFVEVGTVNANNGFVCNVAAGGTLGSTSVTFVQFSGAGQITAGTGMSKTGNTLNVNTASSARIVVGADEIDLATTGVSASTYKSVTVDTYGRVTAGTNPTTLSGFGITDAYTQTQLDTFLAAKLSLTGGTMAGNIAMGSNSITGLAAPANGGDATNKTYVDTILGSATAAATSAAAASASATSASGSASAAASSATTASSAAAAAAASFDSFDDIYLGAKSSAPTVDNDGNPLQLGAIYFNTVLGALRVWTGSAWADAVAAATVSATTYQYTATASQTTFSGVDVNGRTLSYLPGAQVVIRNGASLTPGDNYTASNGTSVVLTAGAIAGDTVLIVAFANFSVADAVAKTGDSMSGPLNVGVNSSSTALRITQTGSGNALVVEDSTNPDATPFVVDSSGKVIIGHTTGIAVGSFDIVGTSTATSRGNVLRYSVDSIGPGFTLSKSRSPTVGTNTLVSSGDSLGFVSFRGADGTNLTTGALIEAIVDGTPGFADMPTSLVISTAADGAGFPTERMRIASTGAMSFGSSGTAFGTAGEVLTSNGSGAAPSFQAAGGGSSFPAGTLMLFAQTAAPTGWVKQTTHDNKALRVVSGTASSGGTVAFTTAFASQAVSGTVGNTTLTTAQIPSHTHTINTITGSDGGGGDSGVAGYAGVSILTQAVFSTNSTGGGGSHNHGFTGTAINLTVQYVDVIIASKT